MAVDNLTAEIVRELLSYDPDTGVFTWIKRVAHRVQVGSVAGTRCKRHARLMILSKQRLAHRVAWLYVHGEWPKNVIDHINRDGFDNRLCNLRDVTQSENLQNASVSRKNKSGVTGVRFDVKRGKWVAEIKANYQNMSLGRFATKDEAVAARRKAEQELFTAINRHV